LWENCEELGYGRSKVTSYPKTCEENLRGSPTGGGHSTGGATVLGADGPFLRSAERLLAHGGRSGKGRKRVTYLTTEGNWGGLPRRGEHQVTSCVKVWSCVGRATSKKEHVMGEERKT